MSRNASSVVLALWLLGVSTPGIGAPRTGFVPDAVVYPVGAFPQDVLNVQAAVDGGGNVLLKSTDSAGAPTPFEFGTGRVFLTQDVSINGETVNGLMTTIHRGVQPFRSVFGLPVTSAIQGIHFDGPVSAAVFLGFSRGFQFRGNLVSDVVGARFGGQTKGQAVWVTEGVVPGGVSGTIVIADNVVERVFADLSYGVAFAVWDASTEITRNVFRDVKDTGILAVGGSQPISIVDNVVLGGAPYPGFFSVGNGIVAGLGAGAIYIARNTVVCDNPFADGIAIEGVVDFNPALGGLPNEVPASAVVEKNDVTMHGSLFGGITIYGQLTSSLISNNQVAGDGGFAFGILPFFGDEVADGTVYRGNNISRFHASDADVFLDYTAQDTVFVGRAGTLVDFGAGNRITGFTNMAGGAGPSIRAAQQQKRTLLQTLGTILPDR
ncbi:MAG: hypothetical protein ABI665_05740 [Vicinamibacterales bacterium]